MSYITTTTDGTLGGGSPSDALVPTEKAVKTYADTKAPLALASAEMFVGNVSNIATPVAMSGDVTNDNAGVQTIANNAVNYGKSYNGNQLSIVTALRMMSGN